jgi:hypothetical protein
VVPCNRSLSKEFLRPISKDAQIYVVNDSSEDVLIDDDSGHTIRRMREVDQDLPFENEYHRSTFFTRRTSGCRNIGVWQAYQDGAEIIINLDDDVIVPEDFIDSYELILTSELPAKIAWSNKEWFNTIGSSDFFARGIPYQDRVDYQWKILDESDYSGSVHMGLWNNVLDYNGIDKMATPIEDMDSVTPFEGGLFKAIGKYIPICAMNVGARREAAMALLQLPMGHQFYSQYKLFRIEDIWAGYIWQILNKNSVSFGYPAGKHLKVGNLKWEVVSENYANILAKDFESAINRAMVGIVDRPTQQWRYNNLAYHLAYYAEGVMQFKDVNLCPDYIREFIFKLSRNLGCWSRMFGGIG